MDFTPEDGFCCPSVEKWSSTSEYDPRISKFMAWVKSLPVKPGYYKRYATATTVAPLKDQPFVIKIVEDGYAFMFHGAFTPREGQGDSGGFDRIPYFDLITSEFKEMQFEGEDCDVVVCEKHGKRFLLALYLRDPYDKDSYPKEMKRTANELQFLEDSCRCTENDDLPVTDPGFVANGDEHGKDAMVLDGIRSNSKCHEVGSPQEWSPSLQLFNDTWTWL